MNPRLVILISVSLLLTGCGGDRSTSRGAVLFAQNCAICHGGDLRGGGGAGVVGLSKTPSDLTLLARNADGIFPRTKVLAILSDYADGTQIGRRMRPFTHLASEESKRVKTQQGRQKVPAPQAAILAYLESEQMP